MPAHLVDNFDHHCFESRYMKPPVSAKYGRCEDGLLGFSSTRISFDDYLNMGIAKHDPPRLKVAPQWTRDQEKMKYVICRAIKCRAGVYKSPVDLPLEKRFALAQEQLLKCRVPLLVSRIDRLCQLYVSLKTETPDSSYLRILAGEIENVDTQILIASRAAAILCGVLYYSYHLGMRSPEVAQLLGIKPPHARQILFRANRIASEQGWD